MLELVDVRAGYGRTEILHGISLTVPTGKTVAVMGHNGAGKTTLLRAAVGLLPVTTGKILFDGDDITSLRPSARVARGLAYVPQGNSPSVSSPAGKTCRSSPTRAATAGSWSPTCSTCSPPSSRYSTAAPACSPAVSASNSPSPAR